MTQIKTAAEHNREAPSEQVQAEVEADLQELQFRKPLVDDYNPTVYESQPGESDLAVRQRVREQEQAVAAKGAKVDFQWKAVTEATRRAIVENPGIRRVAAGFNREPIDELLPGRAVAALAERDPRTARFAAAKKLSAVLRQKAVPDALLVPDVRRAPGLIRKADEARSLAGVKQEQSELYSDALASVGRRLREVPGISEAERRLVARRYRFARDIKMLGLMAELYDYPVADPTVKNGLVTHRLPSGTKLVMTESAFEAEPGLLDPGRWESRVQLKDRVYRVTAGGRDFIMKERKTARHTDTMSRGHTDGLTSEQEFETAQYMAGLGTIRQGDVTLHWERPLGYVEFPDGYQFSLFESEPDLQTDKPHQQLKQAILDRSDVYKDEYAQISAAAKNIYAERGDLMDGFDDGADEGQEPDELTFEEFAELKTHYLLRQARDMIVRVPLQEGYLSNDSGLAFKVRPGDQHDRVGLEAIGFDFEYYRYDPLVARQLLERYRREDQDGQSAAHLSYRIAGKRNIMEAASYAMLERRGMNIPPRTPVTAE